MLHELNGLIKFIFVLINAPAAKEQNKEGLQEYDFAQKVHRFQFPYY